MRYIGVGRRFVALLIDGMITALAWIPFAETSSVDGVYSIRWDGMDFVIPLAITLAYFVVLEGAFGATVGKVVLGIRVRRPDGSRIGFGPALGGNLARVVDAFPYVILPGGRHRRYSLIRHRPALRRSVGEDRGYLGRHRRERRSRTPTGDGARRPTPTGCRRRQPVQRPAGPGAGTLPPPPPAT